MMNLDNVIAVPNFTEKGSYCIEQNYDNPFNFFIHRICSSFTALPIGAKSDVLCRENYILQSSNLCNNSIDLTKMENTNKIKKISSFEDNWDGQGAVAFSQKAIQLFESIINSLWKQPQIAPTGRNSLLMQYEMDDKSMLAFEVGENKTEAVLIPKGDFSLAQTNEYNENIARHINEQVKLFYGHNSN